MFAVTFSAYSSDSTDRTISVHSKVLDYELKLAQLIEQHRPVRESTIKLRQKLKITSEMR